MKQFLAEDHCELLTVQDGSVGQLAVLPLKFSHHQVNVAGNLMKSSGSGGKFRHGDGKLRVDVTEIVQEGQQQRGRHPRGHAQGDALVVPLGNGGQLGIQPPPGLQAGLGAGEKFLPRLGEG